MYKPILICGEAWGAEEAKVRAPFVGASGRLLNGLLRSAGIDRSNCYVTNVFNLQPRPTNEVVNLCGPKAESIPGLDALQPGKYIRKEYEPELQRLYSEVREVNPNLIICLGNTSLLALTRKKHPISKFRGTLLNSFIERPEGYLYKMVATYHPAAVMREWSHRPLVHFDLVKCAKYSRTPTFDRPHREVWIEPTLDDLYEFGTKYIYPNYARPCAVDIETKEGTITEIGFGYPEAALVVPLYSRSQPDGNYWRTHNDEAMALLWVCVVLENLRRPIFQNGLYDLNYLWRTLGIQVPHAGEDTMLLHHSLQPEMLKNLGFLGSVYTDEPSWKLMRKHGTLKKED